MRVLSIHKSAPLVDPRQKAATKSAAAARRNGSGRRNGGAMAKTGP
jgi:hypothetical protein